METYLQSYNLIWVGLLTSLTAGLATGVGAIPILFTKNISKKFLNTILGFAAGIMLAATSFSLIIPAIQYGGGGVKGAGIALVGILIGGIFLDCIDKFFPDTNLLSNSISKDSNLRKVWLFALAITLHNFPEGLAVGVGFGNGDILNGLSIATAIGLQNIPEGLAVALPFVQEGINKWKAFLIAVMTGLVEPLGGLLGVGLVNISRSILPFCLAFAAGAMLFVISNEIIPESQQSNIRGKFATHALLIGFVIMMFLDNVLG